MVATESPFYTGQMHNVSVILDSPTNGGQEFRKAIQSISFQPSQTTSTVVGGTKDSVFTDISPATWTCNMKLLQDLIRSGSLVNYLIANQGLTKQIDVVPYPGSPVKISANIILAVPPIMGDMNAWLDATLQHGVVGAPNITGTSAT
jgi:hypothetical protein